MRESESPKNPRVVGAISDNASISFQNMKLEVEDSQRSKTSNGSKVIRNQKSAKDAIKNLYRQINVIEEKEDIIKMEEKDDLKDRW